jgi:hypothetical protein
MVTEDFGAVNPALDRNDKLAITGDPSLAAPAIMPADLIG